jgi:ComF family protein
MLETLRSSFNRRPQMWKDPVRARPLKSAAQNLIGLVFPARCSICEAPLDPRRSSPLCPEHAREILLIEPPACSKCGRKLFGESVEALICAECRSGRIHYDAGYSAYLFDGPLRELIHLFKYRKRRYLGSFLGGLLLDYLRHRADFTGYEIILPVPLHWWGYCRRGFNQAMDLAKPLSRHFRIPIMKRTLKRVRYTRRQVGLSRVERRANINNAFKVTRPCKVAEKKVLLIDDVITSGATLNECARVLKQAGASMITVLTLAQASDIGVQPPAPSHVADRSRI